MNILYFICAMCNIRNRQERRRREIAAHRQPKWTKRRSDGKKTSNHYFNFCVLSQQHTDIRQARAYSLYSPDKNYLYFAPLSFIAPLRRKRKTPDPGLDRPIFMACTRSFQSLFVLMVRLYELKRDGVVWTKSRGFILYYFLIHIFFLHIQSFTKNRREITYFNLKGEKTKEEKPKNKMKRFWEKKK